MSVWVWGQPGLYTKFQANQNYNMRPCLKTKSEKTKQNKKFIKILVNETNKQKAPPIFPHLIPRKHTLESNLSPSVPTTRPSGTDLPICPSIISGVIFVGYHICFMWHPRGLWIEPRAMWSEISIQSAELHPHPSGPWFCWWWNFHTFLRNRTYTHPPLTYWALPKAHVTPSKDHGLRPLNLWVSQSPSSWKSHYFWYFSLTGSWPT